MVDILKAGYTAFRRCVNHARRILPAAADWHQLFYMSFVSIATFTQPSVELGYAIKFCRIGLTILSWLFGIWGIVAGTATLFIILRSMRAYDGKNYLYPFIPFQKQQVQTLLFRRDAKSKK